MFVIYMGVLLAVTADMAFLLKQRQEVVLPLSFCLICIWVYTGGILGFMHLSIVLFFVFFLFLTAILLIKNRPAREKVAAFFSPGIICYIVLCGVFWICCTQRVTRGGDEYSAWATTVKHMFYTGNFPCQSDSNVQYSIYIPGDACVKYFFMSLKHSYADNILYRLHAMQTLALMVPIFANNKAFIKKDICEYIVKTAALACIPFSFHTACYSLLTIDCILGLMMAYCIMLIYSQQHNIYFYYNIFLTVITMTLYKNAGFVLAGIVICMLLADDLIGKEKKFLLKTALVSSGPVLMYISWKVFLMACAPIPGAENLEKFSTVHLSSFLQDFSEIQMEIIRKFFKAFVTMKEVWVYNAALPITGIGYVLMTVILLCMLKRSIQLKRIWGIGAGVVFGILAYYGMLLYTYLFVFEESAGLSLGSYRRYTLTFWMGIIVGIWMVLATVCDNTRVSRILWKACALSWMGGTLFYFALLKGYGYISNASSLLLHESTQNLEKCSGELNKSDKVYIIAQVDGIYDYNATSGSSYYQAIYILTPVQANHKLTDSGTCTFSLGDSKEGVDISTDYSVQEWSSILLESYTHVYVLKRSEAFKDMYGCLFQGEITDDTLYKISEDQDGRAVLRKVEISNQ